MYYNKVEICGVNTSDLKVLNDEEKRELLLRTRQGDENARQKLINGNLRLVLSIIQRFPSFNAFRGAGNAWTIFFRWAVLDW